jgi:hypothetical protein
MPATTHYAACALATLIERATYLGARSAGAAPREAYLLARHTQRNENRLSRRRKH